MANLVKIIEKEAGILSIKFKENGSVLSVNIPEKKDAYTKLPYLEIIHGENTKRLGFCYGHIENYSEMILSGNGAFFSPQKPKVEIIREFALKFKQILNDPDIRGYSEFYEIKNYI